MISIEFKYQEYDSAFKLVLDPQIETPWDQHDNSLFPKLQFFSLTIQLSFNLGTNLVQL